MAPIVCIPTVSVLVLMAAVLRPLAVLIGIGEPGLPSITNWMVPVGMPAPGGVALTAAVKVMLWPNSDGLAEELRARLVLAALTVWMIPPVLPLKLPSPEYMAVMVWPATDKLLVTLLLA